MTNIEVCKNLVLNEECTILRHYPSSVNLDTIGETALFRLGENIQIYKYHVLHVSPIKVNMWILKILFDQYGLSVNRALSALVKRKNKRYFFTVASYMCFIESYLKL